MTVKTKGKLYLFLFVFLLVLSSLACDDSSGDNSTFDDYVNNPVDALATDVPQMYDDSHLDTIACETANLLVQDMTGEDYCNK